MPARRRPGRPNQKRAGRGRLPRKTKQAGQRSCRTPSTARRAARAAHRKGAPEASNGAHCGGTNPQCTQPWGKRLDAPGPRKADRELALTQAQQREAAGKGDEGMREGSPENTQPTYQASRGQNQVGLLSTLLVVCSVHADHEAPLQGKGCWLQARLT